MLTRRDLFSDAIGVVSGAALVEPVNRWLPRPSSGVPASVGAGEKIDLTAVIDIERATEQVSAADAGMGGGLSREAAVGQLKYTVDLMRHGSYSEHVGNRLLAAIARLASMVGWMSHDAGMEGPAQRYFAYGLQAARESTHERAPLAAVGVLANMARQMRTLGHPHTGVQLVDRALGLVAPQQHQHAPARSLLLNLKADLLASMGPQALPEVRNTLAASFDLYGNADQSEWTWQAELFRHIGDAEFASVAASAYCNMAAETPALAKDAETYARRAITQRPTGFARSRALDQIGLARARFMQGAAEQACDDAETAMTMSTEVTSSKRVAGGLKQLMTDSHLYRDVPRVREFRERLRLTVLPA